MSERSDTRQSPEHAERVRNHEPEKHEYAEYRMSAGREPDDHPGDVHGDALFSDDQADELRRDWEDVQAGFVDDPRRAVRDADQLVEQSIRHITDTFARERQHLESQWDSGGDVSTEELRVVLQRYRLFFNRILSL